MFTNRKFTFYAVCLGLTALLYTFLTAAIQAGQTQLALRLIAGGPGGWSLRALTLPVAAGYALAVPASFLCARTMARSGIRQALIIGSALAAAGCAAMMAANGLPVFGGAESGLYGMYVLAQALLSCGCVCMCAAVLSLTAMWFVRFRGRALGLVTLGWPLCAALGADWAAGLITDRLGGDWRPMWAAFALALALLMPAARFLLRDAPEDTGLYPDGADTPPDGEPDEQQPPLSLGKLLCSWRFWLALGLTGALTLTAAGCLGTAEARLVAKAAGGTTLLDRAATWLALGAIFAIPASYLFGWLCDRLGEVWACLPVLLAGLGGACLLSAFPKEVSPLTGLLLCLVTACLMGGASTLVPALLGRLFGRQQMLAAGEALVPVLALLCVLPALLGGGERTRLYIVLMAAAAAGLLLLPLLALALAKEKKEKTE